MYLRKDIIFDYSHRYPPKIFSIPGYIWDMAHQVRGNTVPARGPKGGAWCFTDFELSDWEEIFEKSEDMTYICFQKEICPRTQKPHYQGYIQWKPKIRKRLSGMKKVHPTAHWEVCRGSDLDNHKYCSKSETSIEGSFQEFGERRTTKGSRGKRSDLDAVKEMIDQGASELEIADAHFGTWCRNYRAFGRYRMLNAKPRKFKTEVIVILGNPGSGKSRKAWDDYPTAYSWTDTKWWDGYENQETVIMDDFKGTMTYTSMLKLLDRYPFKVETKGGFREFNSKRIIITSSVEIEDWYDYDETRRFVSEMTRRIDKVVRIAGGVPPP